MLSPLSPHAGLDLGRRSGPIRASPSLQGASVVREDRRQGNQQKQHAGRRCNVAATTDSMRTFGRCQGTCRGKSWGTPIAGWENSSRKAPSEWAARVRGAPRGQRGGVLGDVCTTALRPPEAQWCCPGAPAVRLKSTNDLEPPQQGGEGHPQPRRHLTTSSTSSSGHPSAIPAPTRPPAAAKR